MDPDAFGFVGQAVATTTLIGVLSGSTMSFVRRLPNAGVAMGVNCGISGALFFGSREFVVSPLLVTNLDAPQYVRRRESPRNSVLAKPNIRQVRMNRLLDSCISGAFTGTILHSIMRGRARLFAGMLTGSLICTSLQYAANELNVTRIRYVSSKMTSTRTPLAVLTNGDGSQVASTKLSPNPSLQNLSQQNQTHEVEANSAQDTRDSVPSNKPYTFSERILDGMSYVFPIKKLTPEEYVALMEMKRLENARKEKEMASRENANHDSP